MKTTLYTLCTAALLLASCANDPAEGIPAGIPGTNGGNLPQGTFVIDYTASTGDAQTRLAANERIQSLDYLLYEKTADGSDFLLKKKRSIPGIGSETQWPLTRENMTWEQREALKDTLNQSSKYKMVFVANANPKIWDNSPVLENVDEGDNFDDGRLVLPPRLFTDKDMYYMWSNHNAPLVGSRYNKDNPASMEIMLERMINKVEVKLAENLTGEGEPEKSATNIAESYYTQMTQSDGIIYNDIHTTIDNMPDQLKIPIGQMTKFNYALGHLKEYLEDHVTDATETVIKYIKDKDIFYSSFTEPLISTLSALCKWGNASYTSIAYTEPYFPNQLSFALKTIATAEQDKLTYDLKNSSFTYYIFGNNEDPNTVNRVESFLLYNNEDTTTPLISIKGTDYPIATYEPGGNHYIIYECNPMGKQYTNSTFEETITVNLTEALNLEDECEKGDWMNTHGASMSRGTFDELLGHIKTASGIDLNQKEFTISVYAVTVSPTWKQNQ